MKTGSVSIRLNRSRFFFALSMPVLLAVALAVAHAQDVEITGSSSSGALEVTNTGSADAVIGKADSTSGSGTGGSFYGGYRGVKGYATESGSGTRVGGKFSAQNSSNGPHYGVLAFASGSGAYAGYFVGKVYTTGGYYPSDEELKTDVMDMDPESSLDEVMQLSPKLFRYRTEEYPEMNLPEDYQMGVLAQDLEMILPELVSEVVPPPVDDEEGSESKPGEPFLAVNYVQLIPVLISSIQEQQWQIEELKAEVAALSRKK